MHFRSILKNLYFWKVDLVHKISKYIPTKAGTQAGGLGFQKSRAGPKAASGQAQGPGLARLSLAWLGPASGFRPEPAHHYPCQSLIADITLDVLKPLLKLPGLSMMELVHQHQLALSQVDIELLASSWPSLKTLILNNETVYLSQSKLTLKALFPFAKHCHKLSHLRLFLDATSVDESFYQPNLIPFQNLKRLSMGVSIIADTESVSLYLSRILPLECKLDSGITWDEKTNINNSILIIKVEERCQAWSKVAETLPMLCTLRMQERERTRAI